MFRGMLLFFISVGWLMVPVFGLVNERDSELFVVIWAVFQVGSVICFEIKEVKEKMN